MVDAVREKSSWEFESVKRTELHKFAVMSQRWKVGRTITRANNFRGISKHYDYDSATGEAKIFWHYTLPCVIIWSFLGLVAHSPPTTRPYGRGTQIVLCRMEPTSSFSCQKTAYFANLPVNTLKMEENSLIFPIFFVETY